MKILLSILLVSFGISSFAANERVKKVMPQPVADKSKATLPGKVELVEPKPFSTVSGTSIELQWTAAEGATSYRVQVAKDPNFKWLVSQQDFITETKTTVSGLEAGTEYHWRVFPWKKDNDPAWTSGFSSRSVFTVK
jgi:hypothetical protein